MSIEARQTIISMWSYNGQRSYSIQALGGGQESGTRIEPPVWSLRACTSMWTPDHCGGTEPAGYFNKETPAPLQSPPPAEHREAFPLSRMTDEEMFASEDPSVNSGLSLRDYRRLTRLYCMNGGHHLQILPDGTVQGQRDDRDVHSKTAAHSAFNIQVRPSVWCVHVLSCRCVRFKEQEGAICPVNSLKQEFLF